MLEQESLELLVVLQVVGKTELDVLEERSLLVGRIRRAHCEHVRPPDAGLSVHYSTQTRVKTA